MHEVQYVLLNEVCTQLPKKLKVYPAFRYEGDKI